MAKSSTTYRPGAGGGAVPGHKHADKTRERIRAGVLIDRIHKIAQGKIVGRPDLMNVQVRAGLGLLKKVLPDLEATDITSGGESIVIERVHYRKNEQT